MVYHVEEQLRTPLAEEKEILQKRKDISWPILEELHVWLKGNLDPVLPKSPIGKAISYALIRWDKLCSYIHHSQLQIDNNLVENKIRPVAIGRKNFMFCGSHKSAQRAAIIYTLFATCELHNLG